MQTCALESLLSHNSFFLFLNKPKGLTSQQCLTQFKKKFGFKKIGHHGTLDPFATGLLLVGVNEATKFFQFVNDSFKSYRATLKLGEATDTLDSTGQITEQKDIPSHTLSELQAEASRFVGLRDQEPPMYSAVKVGGKKLYQLARQGQEIERQSRQIKVKQFTVVAWSSPEIVFDLTVSRGTYVRVLADEFAHALGTVGHLVELSRTELCQHRLSSAVDLDQCDEIESKKIPIEKMLSHLYQVELDERLAREIFFGRKIPIEEIPHHAQIKTAPDHIFFTALQSSVFIGVVQKKDAYLAPTRLMNLPILL